MGGVEDNEPPSKRMKVSSGELIEHSNGTSVSMARPLAGQGDDEVIGSKGVKKVELVRIIADALYSLGYEKTGAHLEEESGIRVQSSALNLFMRQILDGNWDESIITLHKIGLPDEPITKLASFIILEQKFLELLDGEKVKDALKTLRTEIAPLCINNNKVRELSSCIVSSSRHALVGPKIARVKSRSKLLEELQKLFPPSVIRPERRLVHLVEQALDFQQDACMFHNSLVGEMSLYSDHDCGREKIPSRTLQVRLKSIKQ